jgi:hypothetical protein
VTKLAKLFRGYYNIGNTSEPFLLYSSEIKPVPQQTNALLTVPLSGGTPMTVTTVESSFFNFRLTPDNAAVVYYAKPDLDSRPVWFRLPIAGGTPTQLNITPPEGSFVSDEGNSLVASGDQICQIYAFAFISSGFNRFSELHSACFPRVVPPLDKAVYLPWVAH